MQHIVNIAFDFDDDKVTQAIHENVEKKVIDNITDEVKAVMYRKRYYYGKYDDNQPLRNMVMEEVEKMVANHKDVIIAETCKMLTEKIARSKAMKDAIGELLKEV